MSRLDKVLAALATSSPAQLRDQWQERFGSPAPDLADSLLRRAIAQAMQETAFGGLLPSARRTLEAMARGEVHAPAHPVIRLKPGTRLMRQWNGRMHAVLVTDGGFEFDGRTWTSLSAIARRITGAHWSGPRFFGLRSPSAPAVQERRRGQR